MFCKEFSGIDHPMIRIMSWNVNGIRSAAGKGFLDWLSYESPDICCLQEIKARPEDLSEGLEKSLLTPFGYHSYRFTAEKRGYSGTAIYSKKAPISVTKGMGLARFDSEGRVLI